MPEFYRYTTRIDARQAPAPVAAVYRQLQRDLGTVADPVALHAPVPLLLAGVWAVLRESLLAGTAERAWKEAVAAAVATRNRCPWCSDIHGLMLAATGHDAARRAIASGQPATIADPLLRALSIWADQPRLGPPPGPATAAAELVGTAVIFHYLTRMVSVLLVETFLPSGRLLRDALTATLPWVLRPLARRQATPGMALDGLPPAELPATLDWAAGSATIGPAVAALNAISEQQGEHYLTERVRTLVGGRVAAWDGVPPGLSRGWVEPLVDPLPAPEAAAARLALLTALAAYQIDDSVVTAYRRTRPDDAALVAVLAWASWTAARHLGATAGQGGGGALAAGSLVQE